MITLSIVLLLSTYSLPSIHHWLADNKFRSMLFKVSELAKASRLLALSTGKEAHLVINAKTENCIAISTTPHCTCTGYASQKPPPSTPAKCEVDSVVKFLSLDNDSIEITTSSGANKVVTFNKYGTVNFRSNTTIVLKDKLREGRIFISNLGRARSCATPAISGIPKCV